MDKFLFRLFLFVFLLGITVIPINVMIDPYNVFHADEIRDNGVEPNKNYIKTKYVIEHQDEYDSYLFGSSRAGFIDVSKLPDGSWYNLSYSEGVPAEQVDTLKALIVNGEIPKQVYLSLDNISYLVSPEYHERQLYRKAFPFTGSLNEKIGFFTSYLDTITTLESLSVIRNYEGDTEDLRRRMYSTGCEDLNADIVFDKENRAAYWATYYSPRVDEAIVEIQEFCDICKAHDIKLTVFTNPMYVTTYEKSINNEYLYFLERLSEVTDYYNFSGYNRISMDDSYYFETSHFKPEAGEIIMDIMENGSNEDEVLIQGFGAYVTKDNVADFIDTLKFQAYTTGALIYEGE